MPSINKHGEILRTSSSQPAKPKRRLGGLGRTKLDEITWEFFFGPDGASWNDSGEAFVMERLALQRLASKHGVKGPNAAAETSKYCNNRLKSLPLPGVSGDEATLREQRRQNLRTILALEMAQRDKDSEDDASTPPPVTASGAVRPWHLYLAAVVAVLLLVLGVLLGMALKV